MGAVDLADYLWPEPDLGCPVDHVPLVDWDNPITKGLYAKVGAPLAELGADGRKNNVDPFGAYESFKPLMTPFGWALRNSASANYRIDTAPALSGTNGYTTLLVTIPLASILLSINMTVLESSGWTAGALYVGDGTNPRFRMNYNSSQWLADTTDYVVGNRYVIASVSGVSRQELWVNGEVKASSATSLSNLSYTRALSLKSPSTTAGQFAHQLCLVWNRMLTKAELESLFDNPWQVFKSNQLPFGVSALVVLPTIGRPASDTSAGLWTPDTGTTLFNRINEVSPDDASFIQVAAGASPCVMALDETAFPVGADVALNYRASSLYGSTLTVRLLQGATEIGSWTHALTSTITLYSQTLSTGQKAAIIAGAVSVELTAS